MWESSIFVSYTSFNKGLQQKFPQCLGSTWEHFAAGRQRVEKLWENTHTDWDHSTPLHRHHLSATWLQTSQKQGRDGRDNTLRVNIMATRPAKLLLHWINRRSSTGKLDEQHLQHRYCGPCCSSLTSEKDWHTVPFVAHFIYSGWSRQRLKKPALNMLSVFTCCDHWNKEPNSNPQQSPQHLSCPHLRFLPVALV